MYRSIASMFLTHCALLFAVTLAATDANAMDGACQSVSDVGRKVLTTPTHIYTTTTAAFRPGGEPTTAETIYAGGAIYVKVNDHWTRSTITPQDILQQKKENQNNSKITCRYLREEFDIDVGGKLGKSHSSMHYEYGNVQPPQM